MIQPLKNIYRLTNTKRKKVKYHAEAPHQIFSDIDQVAVCVYLPTTKSWNIITKSRIKPSTVCMYNLFVEFVISVCQNSGTPHLYL
jgi:hypothetical protein